MEKDLSSLIRMRALNMCLIEKGNVSIEQMVEYCQEYLPEVEADHLKVEDTLRQMQKAPPEGYNAPVSFDENRGMYSYEDKTFSINEINFNKTEKETFNSVVEYLDLLKTHKSLRGLKALIQKIVDTLKILNFEEGKTSLDFVQSELPHAYGGSQFIVPLIRSVRDKKVVRLYYQPFYEDKPYFIIIHPYLLKEYKNRWYLIGLNDTKKEIRTYGLDRIWEVQNVNSDYIPGKFNARDYFRNSVGIISPIGDPPQIRLEVSKHQSQYLITQPLHESQFIESEDEEKLVFGYHVHPTYEFKSMVLAMGADVRVLSPKSFKQEVLRELNDAILNYGRAD